MSAGIRATAATVVVGSFLASPTTHAAPVVPRPCERVVLSADYASGGAMFCGGRLSDSVVGGNTTGFAIHSSSDKGRTWTRHAALGLPHRPTDDLRQILPSPQFASDRTVVVQTFGAGTFVSNDGGETFLPLLPVDLSRMTMFAAAAAGPGQALTTRPLVLAADSVLSPTDALLIDPVTRSVIPVDGAPGTERGFAVSPDYARDGRALAFGDTIDDDGPYTEVYSCDAAYRCATRLGSLPRGYIFERALFVSTNVVVVHLEGYESARPMLQVSYDAGRTFRAMPAAQRVVDTQSPPGTYPTIDVAADITGRRVFLRLFGYPRDGQTLSRMYRSDDAGRTWRLTAWSRPDSKRDKGRLPDLRTPPSWYLPRETMAVGADGRVVINGISANGWDVACSVDAGVRWTPLCR